MATRVVELHRKKQVELHERDLHLSFDVAQSLFSSFEVDIGTRVLLRTLRDVPARRALDLGCGYGPLGVALQALDPTRHVDMVDRDALAIAFATHNAAANGFPGLTARPSLGYDDMVPGLDEPYDLVAANLPAKAGPGAITALLLDARHVLSPNGLAAVVVVAPLAGHVRATLDAAPDVEVVLDRPSRGYAVFHYGFAGGADPGPWTPGFDRGIYDRATVDGRRTVHGLPEFDSLSFATRLASRMVDKPPRQALLFNPGQGHLAAAVHAEHLIIEDRDLLALRTTGGNEVRHRALVTGDPDGEGVDVDLAIGLLRDQEPPAVVTAELTALLRNSRELVVAGSSTSVTRALTNLGRVNVVSRKKDHGFSAARLRPA